MTDETPKALTHDEIVNYSSLGDKPSDDYMRVVDMLDNVVRECMYVSRSYGGIASPSTKHYYASVLFTALVTKGVTLAQIMPFTPWVDKKIEHWDYASTAGITRTMLELRIAFYYLCTEDCDEKEWDCRWNIFNLHDCTSRIRMFTQIENNDEVEKLSQAADEIRDRIRANPFFETLPKQKQKKALNGQSAYLFPLEDIAEKAGIEKALFRWLYVLLSSHVHALPMSFFRIGEERGRGLPTPVEEGYTSICLSLASTFLVKTRDEVHSLFRDYKARADEIIERENREAIEAIETLEAKTKATASDGMKVGETKVLLSTENMTIEATLVQEDTIEVCYRDANTGAIVLQSTETEAGTYLDLYDLYYWTFMLNGERVTNDQMGFMDSNDFAFKADPHTRTLHFKRG
ncbi:DUF5677 domain-containing protein [Shewanella sp. JNE10-2]|uniref:DUF5677 domain-containing protein n=1 Tax=unclassified Shewanella TaxID=196818 RepID=UPI00200587F8|nr:MULTISPECIES: DUF5677 domain-containing protein [unclassified Shewanella]MCK7631387.1 DUF5677 domain-containing protein [Shewanella sp. JNE9-1]MCK7646675.1 DUF5677 domain-containing protein [Shewanella sp. JNE3-1]MCK7654647.1 DUF5677 domain-containing protein [Shewanella sp. JNE4-1]UPO28106.1 DUF5677 domain-containing protein [Shewanella sp. JNE10-2]UPO35313.1 DUF5677 domain-containing protein [Shewanella sp. JNE7]